MGRGKIEIKKIENVTKRQATFSKREKGIQKKAEEISTLCDARVSLVIFSSSDKMHSWCSSNTTLENILDEYHKRKENGKKLWDAKHQDLSNQIEKMKKENDNIQMRLRHLKGEDIQSMEINDLRFMQDTVDDGLTNIRKQKMEYCKMKKRNNKILEDENEHLNFELQQLEMQNGYNQQTNREYNSQMPFCFRVQPMQPNLQGGMY